MGMSDRKWQNFIGDTIKLTDEELSDRIIELKKKLNMPPPHSGTNSFKLKFGEYEITIIRNDMLPPDGYAIVSPELYEKLLAHFSKLCV